MEDIQKLKKENEILLLELQQARKIANLFYTYIINLSRPSLDMTNLVSWLVDEKKVKTE